MNTRAVVVAAGLASVASCALARADILTQPNLVGITIHEATNGVHAYSFAPSDPVVTQRLFALSGLTNDFNTTAHANGRAEFFDVYVSDALGNLDPSGNYITIRCVYEETLFQGANIAQVELNFNINNLRFDLPADFVASYTLPPNANLSTVPWIVDGSTASYADLGDTLTGPEIRITVGWSGLIPSPGASALLAAGMLVSCRRRRA